MLTQTGLCEILSIPAAKVVDREDTVHWRYTSGAWDLAQPSKLARLLNPEGPRNLSGDADAVPSNPLYRGMIEVVGNSIEHAYLKHPSRRSFADGQAGWWAFQQLRNGELTTCICDLGIGVAEALPLKLSDEPDLLRKLQYLVRKTKGRDVRALLAAVEYGRSGTHLQERGKGLKDAHKVIDEAGRGQLQLISNQGLYVYTLEPEKKAKTGTMRLQDTVAGTIAVWTFPVET